MRFEIGRIAMCLYYKFQKFEFCALTVEAQNMTKLLRNHLLQYKLFKVIYCISLVVQQCSYQSSQQLTVL